MENKQNHHWMRTYQCTDSFSGGAKSEKHNKKIIDKWNEILVELMLHCTDLQYAAVKSNTLNQTVYELHLEYRSVRYSARPYR